MWFFNFLVSYSDLNDIFWYLIEYNLIFFSIIQYQISFSNIIFNIFILLLKILQEMKAFESKWVNSTLSIIRVKIVNSLSLEGL